MRLSSVVSLKPLAPSDRSSSSSKATNNSSSSPITGTKSKPDSGTPVPPAAASRPSFPFLVLGWCRRVGGTLRVMAGVPDYDRYVSHMRAHHPTEPPQSRDAFTRDCQSRRYSRPGARCC